MYPDPFQEDWITWLVMILIAGLVIGSVAYSAFNGTLFW